MKMKNITKVFQIAFLLLVTSCVKEDMEVPYGRIESGRIYNHGYVDLGLPSGLRWATCNLGANAPEEYGDYYAYGEVNTKYVYTESNSKTYRKNINVEISGNINYDAAVVNWSSTWRLPTTEEMEELINNCTWTWTEVNGVYGRMGVGPNGNSIFFPSAGYRESSELYGDGGYGYYWCSTPVYNDNLYSHIMFFDSGRNYTDWFYRYRGLSIRPVSN